MALHSTAQHFRLLLRRRRFLFELRVTRSIVWCRAIYQRQWPPTPRWMDERMVVPFIWNEEFQSVSIIICFSIVFGQSVDYPYINYGIASRQQTNGEDWQQTARLASLERFDPQNLRYFSDHLVDVYEEAATIARPPLQPHCRRPLSNKTGYIVCVYKVFEGDDGEKFERNWLYWTGSVILLSVLSPIKS